MPSFMSAQGLNLNTFYMNFEPTKKSEFNLPFKKVTVLDKRFDTTKIGSFYYKSSFKDIFLNNPLTESFETYFNSYLTKTSNNNLLVVVKFFWLHEIKSGEKRKEENENELRNISECILKADLFIFHDDSYRALIRIDTSFEQMALLSNTINDQITQSLEHVIDKISSINVEQIISVKTKIPKQNVISYYDQRFTKPRVQHDSIQRGLFLSFDDFLFNRPKLCNFSVEQDDESDWLYVQENGEEKLFTDLWGFCDGRNFFVKIGVNFFKINRDRKTYTLWGCRRAVHTSPNRSKNKVSRYLVLGVWSELRTAKLKNLLRPMIIDMDTGIIY
jgi:hypothetical protein